MRAAGAFQDGLLAWYDSHKRSLPWRDIDDAYAVLVSEIMLQQTQVARVVPAFEAFLTRFPTPAALATAPVAAVGTAWQGLGYNRRAVALHRAAQAIVEHHAGQVPDDLDALLALPGIGAYTARAVLAFGFGHDVAPVDTNVARVLSRAVAGEALRPAQMQALATSMVPPGRGRDWSAALMDLGATSCTARPHCARCPLAADCAWAADGGDDPAASRRATDTRPFAGSNRYHRGRLLDSLRCGPVGPAALASAAQLDDDDRARAMAQALVDDGLAQWEAGVLQLPC
jgi:A/G-specific adenine glycosylase